MKTLALFPLVLLLALPPALQAQPPTAPPVPAAVSTRSVVKRTLPNGLRVLVWPRHTAPVVTTMMWYRVGSRDELPGATGLAHFLEHLLFKGTKTLPKGAVDRLTYQHAGSNNALTFNDFTAYEFNFPKQHWEVALRIEADRMRNCVFDKREFEAERQVVMEERRRMQDDPASRFGEQLNTLIYRAHPYRNPVIGWMEDLKRVTRDEVYAFYRQYYVPGNATLVITGDVTPEAALAAARRAFAAVPRLPVPAKRPVLEPEPVPSTSTLRVRLATQVPRLAVAFPAPPHAHADRAALTLLSYVLAEGKLSRLYQRLVERDGTAAAVDAYLGMYRDAGELSLYADVRGGSRPEELEAAVWDEIGRLRDEPVTQEELERARNQFLSSWIHDLESANDLASVLGEADALGAYQSVDRLLERIASATPADLHRVANAYLKRDGAVIGHLLPNTPAAGGSASLPGLAPARRGPAARVVAPPGSAAARGRAGDQFPPLAPLEKVLPNGMRLILLENHDLPSITLSARVNAGAYRDPDSRPGVANMAARLLDEGTVSRDHRQIAAAFEQVGAGFSAVSGGETLNISLQSLSRHTGALLPLFAEIMRSPTFPADRLELERARLLVELKEAEDDAGEVAEREFFRVVYGAHPASRPTEGTRQSAAAISREELVRFHREWVRPERVTLVAVGDFRAGELMEKLSSLFGDWKGEGSAPESAAFAPPVPQPAPLERRLKMDKTQTQILLGHLGVTRTNPDFLALEVMDAILGEGVAGGFTARIPYQLRDVQGLAYSVGSSITGTAAREPGIFVASIGTEPGKEKQALAALMREIRRIRSEPVTPAELSEAVNYLAGSYVFNFQTHGQLANYLQAVHYYGFGHDYRNRFVRDVRRVTRADVQRVARKYLDPEHTVVVVVGPEATVAPR